MIPARNRYAMLVCSLPALPREVLSERQTPLSRLQLDRRLALLRPEDARLLCDIEDLLYLDRFSLDQGDRQAVARVDAGIAALPRGLVSDVVRWRLEERTLMAALRRRHLGETAPGPGEAWGWGRWLDRIRAAWQEPAFGLERHFRWALEAARRLAEGDALGLDRLLLAHTWAGLGRFGTGHYFDFEAVVIYVLKWDIVRRWSSYNGVAARRRFEELTEAGLGTCRAMFSGR